MSPARERERFRGTGLIVLLIAGLALAAVLAWQAADAARSHRDATAAVLRDYTGLAGAEFIRRSTALVGYEGCFRLVAAIRQATAAGPRDSVVARHDVPARLDPQAQRALDLASRYLRFDAASGRLQATDRLPDELSEELAGSLREASGRIGADRGAFDVVRTSAGGVARAFVVVPIGAEGAPADLAGFELDLDALGGWFAQVLDRGPLLPPSIGHGKVGNDRLSLEVLDITGRNRFHTGPFSPYG